MKTGEADKVWKALGDGTRRAILDRLAAGPATTGELVAAFDTLCRTAVMKHLDVLVGARLVLVRREGRQRWNHLNPVPIQAVCERWVNRHVGHLASAMGRLERLVTSDSKPVPAPGPSPDPESGPNSDPDMGPTPDPDPDPAPEARPDDRDDGPATRTPMPSDRAGGDGEPDPDPGEDP